MTTVHDLLNRGYLPKQLPPSFTSHSWGDAVSKHRISAPQKYPDTPLLFHNVHRPAAAPRVLGLPHPAHFHKLTDLIVGNWHSLNQLASTSPISLTSPRLGVAAKGERAIEPVQGFKNRAHLSLDRRRGRKAVLKTDITQCYPALYTHAVSWAIQGKAQAQAAFRSKASPKHFADLIDDQVRLCQERQSIGIPIGPDTSFLLGEIVMTRIDENLVKRLGQPLVGTRAIDDYELFFDSRADAEKARIELSHAAAEFRMTLNQAKTKVLDLPQPLDPRWKHVLLSYSFNGPPSQALKQLKAASDLSFEQEPGSNAITYLLSMLMGCNFKAPVWSLAQSVVLASLELAQNSLQRAAHFFLNATARGWKVDQAALGEVLNRIVVANAPMRLGNPVAWAIWLMIRLGIQLTPKAATLAEAMEDAVVLTVLAHSTSAGLSPTTRLDALASARSAPGCWTSADWLFLYECVRHGWLGPGAHQNLESTLKQEPYLASLYKHGAAFYDENAGKVVARPKPIVKLPDEDAHAWGQIELLPDYGY